jgi:ABC-2 type transport system ATP-binding protein
LDGRVSHGYGAPGPYAGGASPPQDGRIVVSDLTKVFGGKVRAVDQLSFTVEPGSVTGFLGPNGAGKTTTLRMLLGLIHPTSGAATIGGRRYVDIANPLRVVGAALEASSFHPARSGRNHLLVLCAAAGLPDRRADEVLSLVGLGDAARRKVRGYSMGMRQRLGLAATLLGDPRVLILDEPANGLDPEGIRWLRGFFRHLAGEGRTVLVSSHQLAEIQEVADRVVILNRGRLVRAGSIAELTAGTDTVVTRSPRMDLLHEALVRAGLRPGPGEDGTMRIGGATAEQVGHLAFTAGVELHELRVEGFDLEQLFFALTQGQYTGADLGGGAPTGPPAGGPPYGPGPGGPPYGPGPGGPPYGPGPGGPPFSGPPPGGAPWSGGN